MGSNSGGGKDAKENNFPKNGSQWSQGVLSTRRNLRIRPAKGPAESQIHLVASGRLPKKPRGRSINSASKTKTRRDNLEKKETAQSTGISRGKRGHRKSAAPAPLRKKTAVPKRKL